MKTLKLIIGFLFILNLSSYCQRTIPYSDGFLLFKNSQSDYSYFLLDRPITNREYITYLCWINEIYVDYPEILINAFPGIQKDSLTHSNLRELENYNSLFNKLVELSNPIVLNYIFNPLYIDYPVLNISHSQAQNFCFWLTDRLNESILIQKHIYYFDPNQIGSENFTLETYILGQYEGIISRPYKDKSTKEFRRINWSDKILFPSFRLPNRFELKSSEIQKITINENKSFKFLRYWTNYYIEVKQEKLILKNNYSSKSNYGVFTTKDFNVEELILAIENEYTIDKQADNLESNIFEVYKQNSQHIIKKSDLNNYTKNSKGRLPFVLIGEDKESEPIYLESKLLENDYHYTKSLLRVAINAVN